MHLAQIDDLDVRRRVVVLDLTSSPVDAFDPELRAWFHPTHDRDVGMPAVVDNVVIRCGRREVNLDKRIHGILLSRVSVKKAHASLERQTSARLGWGGSRRLEVTCF